MTEKNKTHDTGGGKASSIWQLNCFVKPPISSSREISSEKFDEIGLENKRFD